MKKIQDVMGLSVLDVSSGKKTGDIKDIYFNLDGELKGFAVEMEGTFNKTNFLSYEDVCAIGDDAVTIDTKKSLLPLNKNEYYCFNSGKKSYKEVPLVTTNGQNLGHITDVYFMEELGKIIGYEISDGFISDITEGRKSIQIPKKMIFGDDAIVVPKDEIKEVIFEDKLK